jgi:hypothetical protein
MTQTRIERPRRRDRRADSELLPLDARDPDIVRAKARSRAAADRDGSGRAAPAGR